MKILLINHFPLTGSGSGIYTKNVAERLLAHGHRVKVIVVDNEETTGYNFPVRTIRFYRFPCFTTHPRSNNTFYSLSQQEMNDYLNKFKVVIGEEVESFQPDLIHCQHLWVAPYVTSLTGFPYVITAHGTDIRGFKKDKRYRHIAKIGVRKAKKIIAISEQVYSDVKKYYPVSADNIELILNGFDEEMFKPLDLDKNKILTPLIDEDPAKFSNIVNFVGKLTEFKGVDLLIKAAELYEKEIPGVLTLIAGNGELKNKLMKLTADLDLNSVRFLGNQPQSTVKDLYNIADVSVVPSRMEPFGLVAIEALACGTPVVASNAGGLPDFINEDVGRLFPMDDYRALADNIIKSIEEDDKATKGPYAVEYAHSNFSWERVIEELIAVYKKEVS